MTFSECLYLIPGYHDRIAECKRALKELQDISLRAVNYSYTRVQGGDLVSPQERYMQKIEGTAAQLERYKDMLAEAYDTVMRHSDRLTRIERLIMELTYRENLKAEPLRKQLMQDAEFAERAAVCTRFEKNGKERLWRIDAEITRLRMSAEKKLREA